MWQRFTKEAKAWVHHAQSEAGRFGTYAVSPEHFLLALLHEDPDDPALALLIQLGVDIEALQARVEEQMERIQNGTQVWPPRPRAAGYADASPVPIAIPPNEKTRDQFALDAYSMHLMSLIRSEAAHQNKEEISSLCILLGLICQDEIRQDEPAAIRLFVGTEITLQNAREAAARREGYELAPSATQKSSVWSRVFGKSKSSSK